MTINEIDNEANYKSMFEGAQKIVTISNYVRNQIVEKYGVSKDKIVVIPNSIYISNDTAMTEEVTSLRNKRFLLDDCTSI